MALHTVNNIGPGLQNCLRLIAAGDAVLLIEDGVYAAMSNADSEPLWKQLPDDVNCYVMNDDLTARGISENINDRFSCIEWTGFVKLAADSSKIVSWG